MVRHESGPKVAYTIPLPFGETLDVLFSANAWWMDQTTLNKLILILKMDCSLVQACAFAGITLRQYKYFASLHPKFKDAVRGYQLLPAMQAQMRIVKAIHEGDLKTCWWYLARRLPDEFGPLSRRNKTLKRQQIKEAAEKQKEQAWVFMDPEVKKLTEEYEKRLQEIIVRHARKTGGSIYSELLEKDPNQSRNSNNN